jgi:hypothetical protein
MNAGKRREPGRKTGVKCVDCCMQAWRQGMVSCPLRMPLIENAALVADGL